MNCDNPSKEMLPVVEGVVRENGILEPGDIHKNIVFQTFDKRVVEFGAGNYPPNLYGDDSNYKSFPDIGTSIEGEQP